jgi:hypothetical protein
MTNKAIQKEERRESVRVRKNIFVQYKQGLRIPKQRWNNGFIRDISETGICIGTDIAFKPQSYIRMRLRIPTEQEWLQIVGRAVKSDIQENGYWTHVRSLKLNKKEKKWIRTYIAWVLVKEGGT